MTIAIRRANRGVNRTLKRDRYTQGKARATDAHYRYPNCHRLAVLVPERHRYAPNANAGHGARDRPPLAPRPPPQRLAGPHSSIRPRLAAIAIALYRLRASKRDTATLRSFSTVTGATWIRRAVSRAVSPRAAPLRTTRTCGVRGPGLWRYKLLRYADKRSGVISRARAAHHFPTVAIGVNRRITFDCGKRGCVYPPLKYAYVVIGAI